MHANDDRAGETVAKPNYKFDKRQRDLAKKKQQEEKLLRKRAKGEAKASADADVATPAQPAADGSSPGTGSAS